MHLKKSGEPRPFRLEINWNKTKIQTSVDIYHIIPDIHQVQVAGSAVDVVDSFTYLGCNVDHNGTSEAEITRRIAIARECMTSLDRHIWRSSISVATNIRLYTVYFLPVLLYGAVMIET